MRRGTSARAVISRETSVEAAQRRRAAGPRDCSESTWLQSKARSLETIRHVMEVTGIGFIAENGGGPGARLRK
jgi:hypothetical protein